MALQSVVDVALHFESFQNVDLFHQGLYHLRTRIYREEGEERRMATPYGYSTYPNPQEKAPSKSSRVDHHNLIPAHIMDEQYIFSTRSFLIRYCEEEVEINDIAQFRVELSPEMLQDSVPLVLEVDLMFADLTRHGGADRFGEQPDVDSTEFKSVASQLFRVHGVDQGLHEFCPVVFDEFHFCVANLCIHSVVLDARFRSQPQLPVPVPGSRKSDSKTSRDDAASMTQKPTVPVTQNAALTLRDCIFGNCRGAGREQLLLATEAFYQTHFEVFAKSYAGLAAWCQQVCSHCLTDGQREAFGEAVAEPQPQLTGCGRLLPISPNADEDAFARHVTYDINIASSQIMGLWHKVLNVMLHSCREVTTMLRVAHEKRVAVQWKSTIVRQGIVDDLIEPPEDLDDSEPVTRALSALQKSQPVMVEDVTLGAELQPMLFEQRYASKVKASLKMGFSDDPTLDQLVPSAPKAYRGVHLFVLVHGFQGNPFDMRLLKNNLSLAYPDSIFLVSNSNEDNSDGDLSEMGIRLAQEVVNFICDWCPGSSLGRLSFVGYSIGGIIVRAALPLLSEYHSKLHTFLSLSSLHLGFMDQQSPLFNSVLWTFTKWKKCTLLEQLSFRDAPELKDCYLAKLSKVKGLEHFRWVALVSSKQDNYSPSKSARIEMDKAWESAPSKQVYASMVRNLWEGVDPERVIRFRAHFDIPEKNVDAMIGRLAHIRFIECQPIMRMLIHSYSFLFR